MTITVVIAISAIVNYARKKKLRWQHLHFICISFYVSFLSRVKMNSIHWPAPNVWVLIAQLVEHWSKNAEATDSNPVETPKIIFFSGLNSQLFKLRLQMRWSHLLFKIMVILKRIRHSKKKKTRNKQRQQRQQMNKKTANVYITATAVLRFEDKLPRGLDL